jgi:NAD(P)-dependent dehydrogenase (short-subunit alcohol dehydrogenase family)
MKELSDAIKQKTDTINALVLSTGVILTKYVLTPDSLEAGFAIQYLSRFALTRFLTPELERGSARIVLVVAPVIPGAKIWLEDIALKKNFTVLRALKQEMFANHLFVQEFAKRYPGNQVVMNCANVGFAKTGILRNVPFFVRFIYRLFAKSPEFAARNFVFLTGEQINFSGYFLKKPGHPEKKNKIAYDERTAEKLWALGAEFISDYADSNSILR